MLLVLLIVLVVGGSLAIALSGSKTAANGCRNPGTVYHVTIHGSKVSNDKITAKYCDTITFTNQDDLTREIAFGPHEHHVPYDGIAERVLGKDQSFTITLIQTGSFHWHDHLHDETQGYFTVSR